MTEAKKDDFFGTEDGFEKAPSNWIKWGGIGDKVRGTLIGIFDKKEEDGSIQKIYEIDVDKASFHDIIDKVPQAEATLLNGADTDGPLVYQLGGKNMIDKQMRNCKIGQMFIAEYVSDFKMPKGNAKTIEIKLGGMNPDYAVGDEMMDAIS